MLRAFAQLCIWLCGWKAVGNPERFSRCVMVVAYHTSNWDAFPAIAFNIALNAKVSWVGKESIFWWPLGTFLRSVGGIAIQRNASGDFVSQMVDEFKAKDYFVLAIAPEGTRKLTHRWKTGFYYIALNAGVPVQVAALDYKNKAFMFSPLMNLSGDIKKDMIQIREYLRPIEPKNPSLADKDFEVI